MLSLILAAAVAMAGQDAEKKAEPTPKGTLMPVADYAPRVGDRVYLYRREAGKLSDVIVAANTYYEDLFKALKAGDKQGIEEMVKARHAAYIPSGTRILVLKVPETYTAADMRFIEVRFLDGDREGKTAEVYPFYVKDCRVVRGR